jgi:hypothetical protein
MKISRVAGGRGRSSLRQKENCETVNAATAAAGKKRFIQALPGAKKRGERKTFILQFDSADFIQ